MGRRRGMASSALLPMGRVLLRGGDGQGVDQSDPLPPQIHIALTTHL